MPVAVLRTEVDPFAELLAPPIGETEPEKAVRLRREEEAQRVSNTIDEEINKARAAMKKEKGSVIKVLLLGQSESGKSTTLKNFRMAYAKDEWAHERASWRAVIQMNLIRSIGIILDALQAEATDEPVPSSDYDPVSDSATSRQRTSTSEILLAPRSSKRRDSDEEHEKIPLSDKHENLKRRLAPLQHVESDLKRVLGAGVEEVRGMDTEGPDNVPLPSTEGSRPSSPRRRAGQEMFVRPWLWKEALQTGLYGSAYSNGDRIPGLNSDSRYEDLGLQQASRVIANCKEDMQSLWLDDTVQRILVKRNVRMEDSAGFFLDDLDRIATRQYQPSDDDIVRCRLRTLGVQEYRISFDSGRAPLGQPLDWILYDVGGSRTVRRAWIPYFEDVNAIIFLAPISAFNECLLEDATVNRLQDSLSIWKAICSSKLLTETTLVCFLNKCDLLRKKLRSGIRFRDYVPAFGDDTPNDSTSVVKHMKNRFKDIAVRTTGDIPRLIYIYPTSCTDTKSTAETLRTVRDSILRSHLKDAGLF
ncbi:G-alpha-domain-containing protein [Marasmius fiardii PR-910]|nr:G-alpha-domain-containing protein [Marasmius fiardii PR-910]